MGTQKQLARLAVDVGQSSTVPQAPGGAPCTGARGLPQIQRCSVATGATASE